MLTLKLLGAPTILLDHQPVALKTYKSQALLFYLAVNPGNHRRATLANLLWTELSNEQARKNLRDALSSLRTTCGAYLQTDGQWVAFQRASPYQLDVTTFVEQITTSRARNDLAGVEQALTLYQDHFLAGFHLHHAQLFDQWATEKREELYGCARQNMEWLAEQHLHRGTFEAGLRFTQRLLTLEPWNEQNHLLQMRLFVRSGNRVAAIRQYESCQQVLRNELDVAPGPAITAFFEQVRDGLFLEEQRPSAPVAIAVVEPSPSPPTVAPGPIVLHNLPRPLTHLIGRTTEINQVVRWLTLDQKPLITLLGEGGIGKSRLAVAIAQAIQHDERPAVQQQFSDGIWFVPLVDIVAHEIPAAVLQERIAAQIGKVLTLNFVGNGKLSTQLFSYLRNKALLLILDSFEHLKACAPLLLDLLQAAHQLQIVLTARRHVGLQAEQILLVRGLTVPDTMPTAGPWNYLLRYDAIALFSTLAQRQISHFALTDANVAAVVQICQFAAGSPLAIQLATALLDIHTCQQVAAMLEQDYRVLHSERLDLPVRQRAMEYVLEGAWQTLDSRQAEVLACCSLLRGWFTLEAASAVTNQAEPPLHVLTWHSWLRYDKTNQRYAFHELLRQYAAEQLAQSSQAQAAPARHAVYHINLLHNHEQRVLYAVEVVDMLHLLWSNIQNAWQWAIDHNRLDLLAQGMQGLANFCQVRGLYQEATDQFERAMVAIRQRLVAAEEPASQYILLQLLGCSLNFYESDAITLERQATELLELGRQLGDQSVQVIALNAFSWLAQWHDTPKALALAQEAYTLLTPVEQPRLRAYTLKLIATATCILGEFNNSIHYFQQALQLLQAAPDTDLETRLYLDIGFSEGRLKNFMVARQHLTRALALAQGFYNRRCAGLAYMHLGELWRYVGLYEQSKMNYAQAADFLQPFHETYWQGWLYIGWGDLLQQQGDWVGAEQAYHLAQQSIQHEPLGMVHYRAQIFWGHLRLAQGLLVEASTHYQTALAFHQQTGIYHWAADLYAGLAMVYLAQGDQATAGRMVDAALALMSRYGATAAEEPALVYWRCIQVCQSRDDQRAHSLLAEAQHYLQQQANQLSDEELRDAFLTKVMVNHLLLAARRT